MESGNDVGLLNLVCGYNITMLFHKCSVLGHWNLLWQGSWTRGTPEVPSNPYHSVIL